MSSKQRKSLSLDAVKCERYIAVSGTRVGSYMKPPPLAELDGGGALSQGLDPLSSIISDTPKGLENPSDSTDDSAVDSAGHSRIEITDDDYRAFHLPYTLTAAQKRLLDDPENIPSKKSSEKPPTGRPPKSKKTRSRKPR